MSLATCCPACGTLFRVVPDQLRISDGWVRCGQCGEVFDANEHLRTGSGATPASKGAPPQATAGSPPAAAPPEPHAVLAPAAPPAPLGQGAAVDFEIEIDADAGNPPSAPAPAPDAAAPVPPPSVWPEGYDIGLDRHPATSPAEAAELAGELQAPVQLTREDVGAYDEAYDEGEVDDDLQQALERAGPPRDPSFVRQARRRAFWRRGSVRLALCLLAVLLLLLLVAQLAVHQRDRLAAWQPALRPVLEQLCRPLGCRVGLPRRIEALVIDSSAFSRLAPNTYRLAFTLRNAAALHVALPALELTLTDTQDQPLLRRVLGPAELGPQAPALLGAGAEWSSTLTLVVEPGAGGARVAGYRLLAFYP